MSIKYIAIEIVLQIIDNRVAYVLKISNKL